MDEKDMTLFFHSVLINTYAKIRETVKSKSDVIYIEKDSENEIIIRPIRDYPNFLFQISKPIVSVIPVVASRIIPITYSLAD